MVPELELIEVPEKWVSDKRVSDEAAGSSAEATPVMSARKKPAHTVRAELRFQLKFGISLLPLPANVVVLCYLATSIINATESHIRKL
jgi:hypothetical protein